jgi:hypothetical protein
MPSQPQVVMTQVVMTYPHFQNFVPRRLRRDAEALRGGDAVRVEPHGRADGARNLSYNVLSQLVAQLVATCHNLSYCASKPSIEALLLYLMVRATSSALAGV